jgi:hypothetical protein
MSKPPGLRRKPRSGIRMRRRMAPPAPQRGLLPGWAPHGVERGDVRRIADARSGACRRADPWWPGHAARHGGVRRGQRPVPVTPNAGVQKRDPPPARTPRPSKPRAGAGAVWRGMACSLAGPVRLYGARDRNWRWIPASCTRPLQAAVRLIRREGQGPGIPLHLGLQGGAGPPVPAPAAGTERPPAQGRQHQANQLSKSKKPGSALLSSRANPFRDPSAPQDGTICGGFPDPPAASHGALPKGESVLGSRSGATRIRNGGAPAPPSRGCRFRAKPAGPILPEPAGLGFTSAASAPSSAPGSPAPASRPKTAS